MSSWMRDAAVAFETELRMGQIYSLLCLWLMMLSTLLMTVFKCTLSARSQAVMSNVGHAVHLASLNISGEILEHSHCLNTLKGKQRTFLFHNENISWHWSHARTKAFQSLKVPFSVLVPTVFAFLLPILHSIFRNLVHLKGQFTLKWKTCMTFFLLFQLFLSIWWNSIKRHWNSLTLIEWKKQKTYTKYLLLCCTQERKS